MLKLAMTTSRSLSEPRAAEAQRWARRLGLPLVERGDRSLAALVEQEDLVGVLAVGGDRVTYHEPGRGLSYFFHPGLARRRLHNLHEGRGDPMITAMRLGPGDSVLDCTLGRGSDAILASCVVGPSGRVVGLEKSPVLAWLTRDGLRHYPEKSGPLREAMRRIEVYHADYHDILPTEPDRSVEVVYFDPLFDRPLERSSGMVPLRALACAEPVTAEAVREALRVARRCVVIKQRASSPLWEQLPFAWQLVAGGHSRLEYGALEAEGEPD